MHNFCLNRFVELEETASTQDVAKQLAQTYDEDCVLVQAKMQTGGRGRYDRGWHSAEGGLYISLLLRPRKPVKSTAELSVKTGEAVAQTLQQLYDIKTKIKLPNDVLALYKDSYKKISGVLIETSAEADKIGWLIIGIGVNLNNNPSKDIDGISARRITGAAADITIFRDALLGNFAQKYIQWQMVMQK
ncbi:MAG: biotin--[acetyl-CoA-carboxylase] ligase [Elusimicrobiota bacterium]|jgi:BirA family biotin operon repressor/biotin-[acetyl-CoA-carboxylase] ligase|nr:biotin--[acetyl-CoA-carboxylase] ligase [Elusimicrobiota bacterium]